MPPEKLNAYFDLSLETIIGIRSYLLVLKGYHYIGKFKFYWYFGADLF